MLSSVAKHACRPFVKPRMAANKSKASAPSKRHSMVKNMRTLVARPFITRQDVSQTDKLGYTVRYYGSYPPAGDDEVPLQHSNFGPDGKRIYTRREVASHNTKTDGWVIIHGKVYNVSTWIEFHPGGETPLMDRLGGDATSAFETIGHSHRAHDVLNSLHIGYVKDKKRYTIL